MDQRHPQYRREASELFKHFLLFTKQGEPATPATNIFRKKGLYKTLGRNISFNGVIAAINHFYTTYRVFTQTGILTQSPRHRKLYKYPIPVYTLPNRNS
jgi:hypothetical protein